ncbi:hypothetical protein ACVQ90_01220 [Staphylococcus aureus]
MGVTIIFGAFALFWFVGIHGPSIVEPAIAAITYANIVKRTSSCFKLENTQIKLLHQVHKCLSLHLEGTGATLVVLVHVYVDDEI